MHATIAIDAMRAGKDVLSEKPAARTYKEAEEMLKVQRETGRILNIGVVNRFNDNVNAIKRYVDSGKLGEVFHVYVSFRAHRSIPGLGGAFTTKAIAGGGALIDWGVHYLDIVMYCLGDPKPVTVTLPSPSTVTTATAPSPVSSVCFCHIRINSSSAASSRKPTRIRSRVYFFFSVLFIPFPFKEHAARGGMIIVGVRAAA